MSSESVDAELERLIRSLIPIAKARVIQAAERSPETFAEELWTLASLTQSVSISLMPKSGGRLGLPATSLFLVWD